MPQQYTPASWGTLARACAGLTGSTCKDPGKACVPTAEPPPPSFAQCIWREGDNECPAGFDYTDKRLFYGGLDDNRACTACSCGAPSGSTCTAIISIYSDSACTTLVGSDLVNSTTELCAALIASSGFGSKSAAPPTYHPGACAPDGGEPIGSAVPIDPSTFCCLP